MTIVLKGEPIGKPRMTQSDKWKQRHCVVRYRAWADALRFQAGIQHKIRVKRWASVMVTAYFSIPESWAASKKATHIGTPHTYKPDGDNVLKGLLDALIENDHAVYRQAILKYWDDGGGARIEIDLEEGGDDEMATKKPAKKAVKKPVAKKKVAKKVKPLTNAEDVVVDSY